MESLEKYALRSLEVKGLNPVKASNMSKLKAIFWVIVDSCFLGAILMKLFSDNMDMFTTIDNFSAVTVASQVFMSAK